MFASAVFVPLLGVSCGGQSSLSEEQEADGERMLTAMKRSYIPLSSPQEIGPFDLRDQHGFAFNQTHIRGQWSLLFLGYTHCPDVCPSTLASLALKHDKLGIGPKGVPPQIIFLAVDPKRDSGRHLASFVHHFSPKFVGLTGKAKRLIGWSLRWVEAIASNRPEPGGTTV